MWVGKDKGGLEWVRVCVRGCWWGKEKGGLGCV